MNEMDIVRSAANSRPVNVEAIIRNLGLSVRKDADLPIEISGQIERLSDGRHEISSSSGEHYFRQRFSLAHELGHYILHKSLIGAGLDDNKKFRSTSEGNFYNTSIELEHERQANSFAASILMPERLLREDVEQGGKSIVELYKLYQVSQSAMNWRLKNLGLTSQVEGAA